jgi:hypothetical protein
VKNSLELQLRALRPPRVLKKNDAGGPDLIDVWAMHHADRPVRRFPLAIKFGREIAAQGAAIGIGTLFTIKGRLDQTKNPKTGTYHTFVWADEIVALVPSKKKHPVPAGADEPELPMS